MILTACQSVYVYLRLGVRESRSLYGHIYIFCVAVSEEGFFFGTQAYLIQIFLGISIWLIDKT